MKILYLELRNFANIYAAMERKSIQIDFSKSKNRVILLVGANGSGKTSILSELHPFAYSGNGDIRNNTSLIMPNSKGYKEIHIKDGKDIYKIKHHYSRTEKNTTVKSFIEKNDMELNPNGNVGSFTTIVEEELDITPDYVKLLRLGSNVTTFMDMKATERKKYVSNLLKEIDVYNKLYKKVSEDVRVLSSSLSIVSGKIKRLDVSDISIIEDEIEKCKIALNKYASQKTDLDTSRGEINGRILALIPDGLEKFEKDLSSAIERIDDNTNSYNKIMVKIPEIFTNGPLEEALVEYRNRTAKLRDDINIARGKHDVILDQLSTLYNEKLELEKKIKDLNTGAYKNDLSMVYAELDVEISKKSAKYEKYRPVASRDSLLTMLNVLIEIDDIRKEIQSFSTEAVEKAIDMIKANTNISKYVMEEMVKLDRKRSSEPILPNMILFRPTNCPEDNCPYLKLYDYIMESDDDSKDKISRDLLLEIDSVGYNLKRIMAIMVSALKSLPEYCRKFMSVTNILFNIRLGIPVYSEDAITDIIAEVEEYEDYIAMKAKRDSINIELASIRGIDKEENLTTRLNDVILAISKAEESIKSYKHQMDDTVLKNMENIIDTIETKFSMEEEANKISEIIEHDKKLVSEMNRKKEIIQSDVKLKSEIDNTIDIVNGNMRVTNDRMLELSIKEKEFKDLNKELDAIQEVYDEMSILRKSLTSTKGLPLVHVQIYFKSSRMYVNELLDIVYGGKMQITDFDVQEDSFTIPYIKNGIEVDDVAYVSQGEKSFFSIAISFALMSQSMSKYNIPLLDEPDSTLDTKNRALFLDIVERQLNAIDAEQMFMITHNDMFDSYPVDLIMTSDVNINTKGRTILFKND